ncbi:hypothetical protein KIW84_035118 [Lathyrus oleraceus]|uniref:Arabidopsis retrotransposon Orf1 C-terminal domain-containing protein n=1 Tax=Pisum sativum TaxID=3888 RepID=A0A9D4Y5U0_PEA|nr:hypothetical protein KIW84_035118 [Pisum sativum]
MPPREVRPRREINYIRIAFAEGIDRENQKRRYHKLLRDVLATRYLDDATLRALGLFDSVHWMLNNLGGSFITGTAHFRMFNRSYVISRYQMADLLSFPHGDEFACQHRLESEWESNALDFWKQLTGKTTTDWEGLKATAIQNLIIRYLHRILARTIFGRENIRNTFDITSPEPDHMEKDAPHTSAHAHTTHAFPDPFVGTSSGYQPHEEYDYTAIRTALDDILSELRHRNNVDADRDVLLRNI